MSRHHLPQAVPASEAAEDDTPLLWQIPGEIGPGLDALWLGNLPAAEDRAALQRARIGASLNLAMNIFPGPLLRPDGTHLRRYQIGLLDGPGNAPETLAAAVTLIDGLAAVYTEGKPHYPAHEKGGLLVHCRGGRSRSVTVLALWLHLRRPAEFPRFEEALAYLRALRGLDETYPLPPMLTLAREVLDRGLCTR
ncbi:dual specificity protein phosphatase family protein [Alloyangia pacifica]|uniref:Myo-inositol-1(Or 4)-monophosphatase n=1 Tax=Alloyangia pacifica TaxID=311180 RepID=A0A1I6T567_9RHOB|nr:dual specificity protein phosphatase [Alloyangia pacifica]SDG97818.1 myo-inositol-1(or 4)-monophosphatase [Alloyangia pacifica]SFS84178.1 myo-inositol-1(or 4)-monophosphatase [Alloyangia pacifica]